jgi:hypothetical protein
MYRKGKDIRKKIHQIFKLPNLCGNPIYPHEYSFVFVPFVFGEKFPTAKFFMRTFTCRSTFLYGDSNENIYLQARTEKCVFL